MQNVIGRRAGHLKALLYGLTVMAWTGLAHAQSPSMSDDERRKLIEAVVAVTPEEVRVAVSDRTNMVYDTVHGTQVEFTSADGRAFLWYPGNSVILPGAWKIDRMTRTLGGMPREHTVLCFRYTENSYNPATGHSGADWECNMAYFYINKARRTESVGGDVLGLATMGRPPFKLTRDKTTLAELAARITRGK